MRCFAFNLRSKKTQFLVAPTVFLPTVFPLRSQAAFASNCDENRDDESGERDVIRRIHSGTVDLRIRINE
jgi:hypothetical protein